MEFAGGAGTCAGAGVTGAENKGNCAASAETDCGFVTLDAGFQRVEEPQRLQKRRAASLVAQMSASKLESSTVSRVLQELQARERRPSSFSKTLLGGKSISQKLTLESKKATP